MKFSKLMVAGIIAAGILLFFLFDLGRFLELAYLKSQHAAALEHYQARPVLVIGGFALVYIAVTALSVPGAALLTLVAGALFGLAAGTIVVSFASTIGATLAFLSARFLFRDSVQARFGDRLAALNRGMERDGSFYLFALRLVPVFPFFVINLAMGLTPIRTPSFFWVSQLGMLPGTLVYVNAGTQLARIETLGDIASPQLLIAFALLGLFPLMARWVLNALRRRRLYAGWPRPPRFDRNLIVIGGGSAGLVSAYIAAAVKADVTLVESHRMGGDCLNTGCVPSKALIRSTRLLAQMRRAEHYGLRPVEPRFDFAEVMDRVQRVIKTVEPHDSVERYRTLGVDVRQGRARLLSPHTVEITAADGGRSTLSARAIVIATGARPFVPPIPGLAEVGCLTSDNLWSLRRQPRRLLVLGGGPIGCELAQCFARLGTEVTLVEMADRLLVREDPDVSDRVQANFQDDGIRVLTGHKALRVESGASGKRVTCALGGREIAIDCDEILCAVGRKPNTEGLGLETLGIEINADGTVRTDEFLQTRYPNILACGDVAGPYQFTHTAAHQAWYAAVNGLFGQFKRFRADYAVIPWTTFTDPEVARVGLNETEARARGIAHEVTTYGVDDLDRAIADGAAQGFVKVLTVPGKDRILGATIVAEHAGELITEFVTAMKRGLGLNKILGTIHVYPTFSEANKYAAGEWKRAHAPARVLTWLARYHRWRRGGSGEPAPQRHPGSLPEAPRLRNSEES